MCFLKEFGTIPLVIGWVSWKMDSDTWVVCVGGLLGILQEGTTAMKREKSRPGTGKSSAATQLQQKTPQGHLALGWPFRVAQLRQRVWDPGESAPWEGANLEWGSFLPGDGSCELPARPTLPAAEGMRASVPPWTWAGEGGALQFRKHRFVCVTQHLTF